MKTLLKFVLIGLAAKWVFDRVRNRTTEETAVTPATPATT
jgi:hypothetical protein